MARTIKSTLFKIMLITLSIAIIAGIIYLSKALPIITAFRAKDICSCVFLGNRAPDSVKDQELTSFPLSLGEDEINTKDSVVRSSVFGLARKYAVYRKGLGCTLAIGADWQTLRDTHHQIATPPAIDQDTIPWPDGNLLSGSLPQFDKPKLDATIQKAFLEPNKEKPVRTRAVIVVYKGQIIGEQYAEGFSKSTRQAGWSMTKSITNALVGILVKQKKLNVMDAAPVEEWKNDDRAKITLNDLLHMSSGLDWEENYKGPSSATTTLFATANASGPALHSKLIKKPGEEFTYSSGTSNIISRIIRDHIDSNDYYKFPYLELFYKIGMLNTTLEPDAGGTFVGSSFCFGTARDWARFGLLNLHDGVWNEDRILPDGWVRYSSTPAPAAKLKPYGAHFWLNASDQNNPSDRIFPSAPADLYWADGFDNQKVFIIPSLDLVIVKLSSSQNYMDDDGFLKGIIASIQ
ncbi:MAG: serine hydrolase [Saprospiraceae bacterium]|uniref:Serine hydrolase n=1 Tax=Candidatus Opimibacter skivensis TaxID=2982028 RepID=A0A9D7T315_9BACT|nr:serine hydrolase [Candidatus Opimibacter skivensis]